MYDHNDIMRELKVIDGKVDKLTVELEVHKVKTSRFSMVLGGLMGLLGAGVAVLLKGCL